MTISPAEYADRRQRLMDAMGPDGLAIVAAAPETVRNRDVHHPYRPDSDFRYLTGFTEPDAVAVFAPGREAGEFLLFCRDRDPDREIWEGLRAGPNGARTHYAADEAAPVAEFAGALPGLLAGRRALFYSLGQHPQLDKTVLDSLQSLRQQSRSGLAAPPEIVTLDSVVHPMRLYKSAAELDLMRAAAATSARAHRRAMQATRPGRYEYQIAAELHYEFALDGMQPAYPSIVGGGANGCILHYIENNAELADGDLLLIDAGAENAGYAADITRSFPVNGRFSGPQRELYELVLAAQLAAVDAVRAGNDYQAPHRAAVGVLTRGMVDLGLLAGDPDELIEQEAYRRFYMHGTGHWLGMDVHDVGDYKIDGQWRKLESDMTVTIEPGIYIRAGTEQVDQRFWDIGVRIEDDVRVTAAEPEVLSADVPKTVHEIEALLRDG